MLLPAEHIWIGTMFPFAGNENVLYTGDYAASREIREPARWRGGYTHHGDDIWAATLSIPASGTSHRTNTAVFRETIDARGEPVLLGYSLGKAQEILCSLDGAGFTPMLHGSVYQMARIYEQFGQSSCEYLRYKPNDVAGKVLICPPSANHSRMLEKIGRKRVAMISGWLSN